MAVIAQQGYYDVRQFGTLGSGDNTLTLQHAMDAAWADEQTGIFIPPWPTDLPMTQLRIKKGMSLLGGGFEATRLAQLPGVNTSMLVNDPATLPATEYMHWCQLSNFKLKQQVVGENTQGHGIEIGCRTGEAFRIARVNCIDMPQSGVCFRRGGVPCLLMDLHGFRNGEYLLDITRTSADTWQMFEAIGMSGDNNGVALIRIKTAGANSELFHFLGIKSETSQADTQASVFVLDTLNGAPVYIENLSAITGGPGVARAFVTIVGAGARVSLTGARAPSSWPLAIDDQIKPGTVSHVATRMALVWSTAKGLVHEIVS